jgi:hypothetical protein
MKTNLLLLSMVFSLAKLIGQDHFVINFDGVNANPETVIVKNQTQNTEVTMQGDQTLHLMIQGVSVNELPELSENQLVIYPNPSEYSCNIEFKNFEPGRVVMQLFDLSGRIIHSYSDDLRAGKHTFLIKGLSAGSYILSTKTKTGHLSGKFVVTGHSKSQISLQHIDEVPLKSTLFGSEPPETRAGITSKIGKSVVEMDFWPGDEMLFLGKASGYANTAISQIPEGSQTVTFVFTPYVNCVSPTTVVEVINPETGRIEIWEQAK